LFGWNLPAHRPFFSIAAICVTVGVAFTLTYVHPINEVLFGQAGGNRTDGEIRALLRRWILVDRARFLFMSVGYLALLRALSIAMPASRP